MSSGQGSFAWRSDPHAEAAWVDLREAFRSAVAAIGLKEAAFRLDVSPSLLSDALAERDRKGLRLEWLPALLLIAPAEHAATILGLLASMRGLEVVRRKALTPEEKLERLTEKLRARFGAAGAELAAEVERG
jgi:hypothetical protein